MSSVGVQIRPFRGYHLHTRCRSELRSTAIVLLATGLLALMIVIAAATHIAQRLAQQVTAAFSCRLVSSKHPSRARASIASSTSEATIERETGRISDCDLNIPEYFYRVRFLARCTSC